MACTKGDGRLNSRIQSITDPFLVAIHLLINHQLVIQKVNTRDMNTQLPYENEEQFEVSDNCQELNHRVSIHDG